MSHIRTEPAARPYRVEAGGVTLGTGARAVELYEGGRGPTIYVDRADLDMTLLEKTDRSSTCPHKGRASYYSIKTPQGVLANAVWSYEAPTGDSGAIKGHLAFYTDRVTLTQV